MTMRIIQASGKLTRATGAYIRRICCVRLSLLQRGTRTRYTKANIAWASLGEPSWGSTTVLSADPRTASANTDPATSDNTRRAIIG